MNITKLLRLPEKILCYRRLINIIIGLDQFLQVLIYLGNYTPDETISGIIGRKIRTNKANIVEKGICWESNASNNIWVLV